MAVGTETVSCGQVIALEVAKMHILILKRRRQGQKVKLGFY